MKKINAFTLAEMIISLVIVATIAAMLMMRFKNVSPKENILNYKKAYTTIQQAVSILANDRESFPDSEKVFMVNANRNATTGALEFEMTDDTFTEKSSSNYFCTQLARTLNTIGTPTCSTKGVNITLTNGMQLINVAGQNFAGENATNYLKKHIDIIVDTNGRKAPNSSLASDKRDRFKIRIFFDGKVTTDPNWIAENEIFNAGSKAQTLHLGDYIHNDKY